MTKPTRQFTSYKLGSNFDVQLISQVKDLNDKYKDQGVQVDEFYGSDRDHAFLAARPDFRLPDVSQQELASYVRKALDAGINFNYTMNSINPGSKRELDEKKHDIKEYIKFLEGIGVHRITAANPIIFEMVREVSSTMKLEVSTIMHVDTVTQIKYLKDTFNIDKVCGNLLKNRNKRFLKGAADYCNANGLSYEIMVNEFCGVGTDTATTHCTLRDACYTAHATDKTKEDALLFETYPMKHCIWARENDVTSWLKLRFVRPEDIYRYEDLGIYNYKITGRTGTTKYIATMAEAYLSRSWEGNLLQLWKPLETIFTEKDELDFQHNINIPNKELNKFVGKWFAGDGFRCEEELCGETCHYCQDYFNKKFTDDQLEAEDAHTLGCEVIPPQPKKKIIPIRQG